MNKMRVLFKILSAVLIIALLQCFCHKKTGGFAVEKISSSLTPRQEWETLPLSPQEKATISSLLQQKFTYLGKGAQAYVFESEDKKHVLKFFRHSHMRPPFWIDYLPSSEIYKKRKRARAEGKLHKDFLSYKLAFEELREETGLLFIHLNKTQNLLNQKITFYDKIGIIHQVDADSMEFVLQKKASLIYPTIEEWMKQGEYTQAKAALSSLLSLLKARCEKGIWDKDPDLNTNFGLVGARAIQIDIGRFRRDDAQKNPTVYKRDILRVTDNLRQWLGERSPELSRYIEEELSVL